jgi:magnesium-transporting ATPase (P-type)
MVEFVFSDKTGTLTQNLMEFKCFTVGMNAFGKYHPTKVVGDKDAMIKDDLFEQRLKERDPLVTDYLRFLALCHDVTIDNSKGKSEYTSASPDEIAFVEFSRKCGVHFCNKDAEDLVTLNNTVGGQPLREEFHKIEGTCAFTSDRKMSSNIYL